MILKRIYCFMIQDESAIFHPFSKKFGDAIVRKEEIEEED